MKCEICGREFIPYRPNAKVCSRECRLEAKRRRYRKDRAEHPEKYLSQRRAVDKKHRAEKVAVEMKLAVKKCRCCGKEFQPIFSTQLYCSDACRNRYYKEFQNRKQF